MPIINEPKLQSGKQKVADRTIITVGLAIFSFFLLLLTLVLWGAAGKYFYSYLFSPQDIQMTITMLTRLALVALVVFIIMLVWSKYNLKVFGSLNRRHAVPLPPLEATGTLFAIENEPVALAQTFKSATLEVVDGKLVLCSYHGTCFPLNDPTAK